MKRKSLLLAILLLFVFVCNASASTVGDTVTVPIQMSNKNAIAVTIKLSYDTQYLEFVSIKAIGNGDGSSNQLLVQSSNPAQPISSGKCGELTLKIKEGTPAGTYKVSASVFEAGTLDESIAEVSVSAGSVTVDAAPEVCTDAVHAQQLANGKDVKSTTTAATCTAEGKTVTICTLCSKTIKTEAIPAKGHTEVVDAAVAATCTAAGKTEGKHCSVCNEVLVKQDAIPAKGHTEVKDAAVAATCTAAGKTEGKHCSVCNEVLVKQEAIPAKGHTEVIDKGYEPTRTETGLTDGSHCSVCGAILKEQTVIPPTEHMPVIDPAVAPKCNRDGKTEGSHCEWCGKVMVAQETIPALSHWYGDWTPNGDGTSSAECQRPGCNYVRTMNCVTCDVTVQDGKSSVCLVCGAFGDTMLPRVTDAKAESITKQAVPANGETTVFAMNDPYEGVLAMVTAAREYGGEVLPFNGDVRIILPLVVEGEFRVVRVDTVDGVEQLTEVPFTYANGMLTIETNVAGVFLLLAK